MKNLKEVYFPENLNEFLRIFNRKSYLVAGSVYSFRSWQKRQDIEKIIFIDRLPLNYIRKNKNYVAVGSLVTFDTLEHDKILNNMFGGYVSYAARKCSSQLIRNMATVGGNISHLSSFNIIPIVAKTLDAEIIVFDREKEFKYCIDEFYKEKPTGLIKEIRFPVVHNKDYFLFEKISKTESSWDSYIIFSFRMKIKNDKILDTSFVFGGITPLPFRNIELEKGLIIGKKISDLNIEKISTVFADSIYNINPSHHLSLYRKSTTYTIISDFLSKAKKEA